MLEWLMNYARLESFPDEDPGSPLMRRSSRLAQNLNVTMKIEGQCRQIDIPSFNREVPVRLKGRQGRIYN